MSDVSLLNSVYANVEAFSTLIDNVIQRLQQEADATPNVEQTRLGTLLVTSSSPVPSADAFEALVLESLLRSATGERPIDFERLGRRLLNGTVDSADHKQLELLAKGLDRERSDVAARLRGRR